MREGLIDRFGSIDPTEGGVTERTNLNAELRWTPRDSDQLTVHAYASYYVLSLFNDFSFFLNDPVNGDEINQRDRRWLAGLDLSYERKARPLGVTLITTGGLQYRLDAPHVVLANATQRHQTGVIQNVDIVEQSYSPFVKLDVIPVDWLRIMTGASGDIFNYDVTQHVNAAGGQL